MDNLPNIADIGVVVVLLVSALLAFARGFVHEVLAVAGWIGAGAAAFYGYPYLRPYADEWIPVAWAVAPASIAVIFVVSAVILFLLTSAVSKRIRSSALNALDRSLGFLFGALRGAVIICLVYIGMVWILSPTGNPNGSGEGQPGAADGETPGPEDPRPRWLLEARSLPLIEAGAELIASLVPADQAEAGAKAIDEAREKALRAIETKKVWREMLAPRPKGDEAGEASGYGSKERQDMERLIESNQ